jgi:HK97 family phage major capsid protein
VELTQQLAELTGIITTFQTKAQGEMTALGSVQTETKAALTALIEKLDKLQTQADAIDLKMATGRLGAPGTAQKSMGELFTEDPAFLEAKEHGFNGNRPLTKPIFMKRGAFERKTNITDVSLGIATSNTLLPNRLPGVTGMAQQGFRLRDLIRARTLTTGTSFDFVKQSTRTNATSPQQEAAAKAESTYLWNTGSDQIRTLAHFVNVSRQALDDLPWLRDQIDGELLYGLQLKEEQEILSGDGTGVHLNGVITQATAFSTSYVNLSRYQQLDVLRFAKLQARLAGLATYAPDAFVLNPTDMANLELIKSESGGVAHTGVYIIGDPRTGAEAKFVWGLPVVESDTIAAGTFLVGAFGSAVELVDRMQSSIDISFEHNTNFTQNLATLLCEERVGLAVRVPGAFIKGSFASSPA